MKHCEKVIIIEIDVFSRETGGKIDNVKLYPAKC